MPAELRGETRDVVTVEKLVSSKAVKRGESTDGRMADYSDDC